MVDEALSAQFTFSGIIVDFRTDSRLITPERRP